MRLFLREMLDLFFWPLLAALLPSPWRLSLLRHLARNSSTDVTSSRLAWTQAQAMLDIDGAQDWQRRFRLLRWVDRSDSFLVPLRGRHWWARQVVVSGKWPEHLPCVFLTYHWGAGHWIWRLFQLRGIAAHFIARPTGFGNPGQGRIAHGYARWRAWTMRRIGGLEPIYTGGSSLRAERALTRGESIVGMLDLPARTDQHRQRLALLGRRVEFPTGLVDLAIRADVPIVIFSGGFDSRDGRRHLNIESLPPSLSAEQVMRRYTEHLEARITAQPEAWHFWASAREILDRTPQ